MFVFVNFSRILAKLTISRFIFLQNPVYFLCYFSFFQVSLKSPGSKPVFFLVIFYIFFSYFYHFCEFVDTDAGSQSKV